MTSGVCAPWSGALNLGNEASDKVGWLSVWSEFVISGISPSIWTSGRGIGVLEGEGVLLVIDGNGAMRMSQLILRDDLQRLTIETFELHNWDFVYIVAVSIWRFCCGRPFIHEVIRIVLQPLLSFCSFL